jgi:hypothetical protein
MQLAPWDNEYNQAKYDEADGNEDVPNNGSVMLNKINSTDYMTMTKDDKVSDISEWFCDQVMHGNQYLKCRTGLVDPTNQQFESLPSANTLPVGLSQMHISNQVMDVTSIHQIQLHQLAESAFHSSNLNAAYYF